MSSLPQFFKKIRKNKRRNKRIKANGNKERKQTFISPEVGWYRLLRDDFPDPRGSTKHAPAAERGETRSTNLQVNMCESFVLCLRLWAEYC